MPEIPPVVQFEQSVDRILLADGVASSRPLCKGCQPNFRLETSEAVISREYFDRADKRVVRRSVVMDGQMNVYGIEGSAKINRELIHKIGGLASQQARDFAQGFTTRRKLNPDEQLLLVNWLDSGVSISDVKSQLEEMDDSEFAALQNRKDEALEIDKSAESGSSGGLGGLFAARPLLIPQFRS